MSSKQFVFEDFADKVGHTFSISDENGAKIPASLTEAELLAARGALEGTRPPFSLIFLAKDARVLPQRVYRMQHDGLGELAVFLVPIGKDENGVSYQATFN